MQEAHKQQHQLLLTGAAAWGMAGQAASQQPADKHCMQMSNRAQAAAFPA